jgi:DNA-binding NarL/FixJ family response regulator
LENKRRFFVVYLNYRLPLSENGKEMKNLVLADNQEITRLGLKALAAVMPEVGNLLETSNREALVKVLLQAPDSLVVMDYTLFDLSSVDELHILENRFPEARWLLFCNDLSEVFLQALWVKTEGVSWLSKDAPLKEIQEALAAVLRGERVFQHQPVGVVPSEPTGAVKSEEPEPVEPLTATEREILKSIALGKTTKEVASERYLSVYTVMTHRKNIFRKLRVNNLHEATKYAMRAGLVDMAEYCI